jgi:hypothetical protein
MGKNLSKRLSIEIFGYFRPNQHTIMKRLFIATCIICAVILSCKKKDKDPPKTNTTTTTGGTTTGGTTTGGSTTGGSGNTAGTPTNATTFVGIFTTAQSSLSIPGLTMALPSAEVYFSSTPVADADPNTGTNVNSVTLNGEVLTYASDSSGVYSSTNSVGMNLNTQAWLIDGANGIPSFTTNNGLPDPSGLNTANVPSTISKAAGVTINLGTLSNLKSGQLIITDGTSSTSGIILMPLSNGAQNITLSSGQLNGFTAGNQQASIIIMLENSEARNIGGKNFKFIKQVQYVKGITINN